HRLNLRLGERLTIHLGDETPGHLLPDVVAEVQLDHAPRDLALAKTREPRLLLNLDEGTLPRFLDDLGRLLHVEAALARSDLVNATPHRASSSWCERGELTPHGVPPSGS